MLHDCKRRSILQWYNSLTPSLVLESISQLSDGSFSCDVICSASDLKSQLAEDIKSGDLTKKYNFLKKFIDESFNIDSESVINYADCMSGKELELAKMAVFILTAIVQVFLASDNPSLNTLTLLDSQVQLDIEECMTLLLELSPSELRKAELHRVLSRPAKSKASPRRRSSTPRRIPSLRLTKNLQFETNTVSPSFKIEDEVPASPLQSLLDSPKFQHRAAIFGKEKEILKLRDSLHAEETKVTDLNNENKKLKKDLQKKSKEIQTLKKKYYDHRDSASGECLNCKKTAGDKLTIKETFAKEVAELGMQIAELKADNKLLQDNYAELEEKHTVCQGIKDQASAFSVQKTELDDLKVKLGEKEAVIDLKEKAIQDMEVEIKDLKNAALIYEQKLLEATESKKVPESPDLGERLGNVIDEEYRHIVDEMKLKDEKIYELQEHLKMRGEEFSKLQEHLSKLENEEESSMFQQHLKKNEEVISELQQHLKKKEKEISDIQQNLKKEKEEISKLQLHLKKKEEEISEFQQKLKEKEKTISELQQHLKNKEEEISECEQNLKREEEKISELQKHLKEKEEAFESVKMKYDIAWTMTEASQGRVSKLKETNDSLEELLKCKEEDIKFLNNQLQIWRTKSRKEASSFIDGVDYSGSLIIFNSESRNQAQKITKSEVQEDSASGKNSCRNDAQKSCGSLWDSFDASGNSSEHLNHSKQLTKSILWNETEFNELKTLDHDIIDVLSKLSSACGVNINGKLPVVTDLKDRNSIFASAQDFVLYFKIVRDSMLGILTAGTALKSLHEKTLCEANCDAAVKSLESSTQTDNQIDYVDIAQLNEDLRKENDELKVNVAKIEESYKVQLSKADAEKESILEHSKILEQNYKDLLASKELLQLKIKELEGKFSELELEQRELLTEKEKLQEKYKSVKFLFLHFKEENTGICSRLKTKLRSVDDKYVNAQCRLKELQNVLEGKEKLNQDLNRKLQGLKSCKTSLESQNKRLEEELNSLKEEKTSLAGHLDDILSGKADYGRDAVLEANFARAIASQKHLESQKTGKKTPPFQPVINVNTVILPESHSNDSSISSIAFNPSKHGGMHLYTDDEEDFLNHSSIADIRKDVFAQTEPNSIVSNRLSELRRRNTLCLPHLQSSYPVELQTLSEAERILYEKLKSPVQNVNLVEKQVPEVRNSTRHILKKRKLTEEEAKVISRPNKKFSTPVRMNKAFKTPSSLQRLLVHRKKIGAVPRPSFKK